MSTTLGDLCGPGGVQTGPFGSQLHAHEYSEGGTPVVMPQDIGENIIRVDSIARVPATVADRLGRHRLREGDIVYSRRGDVERRALVRNNEDGWLCGTGCLRVRLDPDRADARFVSYYLGRRETREWITGHAVGGTMLNLNTGILASVPVTLPDMRDQRSIGELLGGLDDKIAANARLLELANASAAGLVTRDLTGEVPLSDVASVVMGSSPKGDSMNEIGEGIEFFQGVRDFGPRVPTSRIHTTEPVRLASAGDVLVSVRAPVGKINRVDRPLCIGRGLAAITSITETPCVLFHALRMAESAWQPFNSEGTVFGSINQTDLKRVAIPWSGVESVVALESELAALERRIDLAVAESRKLAELRDTLLPALMSGRVSVREAEATVGAAL